EVMAESGGTGTLRGELNALITAGSVREIIGGGGNLASGTTTATFEVACSHPLASAVSMVAPSPDWFTGVRGVSLLDADGRWRSSLELPLHVYDAGTDSGPVFTSPNADITPHIAIIRLPGDATIGLQASANQDQIGRMVFERADAPAVAAPALTNAPAQTFTVGQAISEIVFPNNGGEPDADDAAMPGCTITNLPNGLIGGRSTDRMSCRISGTPMAVTDGAVLVAATARNAGGSSSATVSITVEADTALIKPALPVAGGAQTLLVNQETVSIVITNTGGGQLPADDAMPAGCAATGLPMGLSIGRTDDRQSCQITGVPLVPTDAVVTVAVTATNDMGAATTDISLMVLPSTPASDCPVGGASGSPATPVASYSVRFIADWSVANNGVLP
nr:spondin domain-containing protein [Pseudomonadota bacterium]